MKTADINDVNTPFSEHKMSMLPSIAMCNVIIGEFVLRVAMHICVIYSDRECNEWHWYIFIDWNGIASLAVFCRQSITI